MDRQQPHIRLRFAGWAVLCLFTFLGQLLWLYSLRGPRILDRYTLLIAGQIALVIPLILIALLLKTTPANAIRLTPRVSNWIILAGAFVLQGSSLILLWPALSEDVTRYRLDGRMCLAGVSPYAVSPVEFAQRNGQLDSIDRLIPHSQIRAIYPPLAQAIFAIASKIEHSLFGPPPPIANSTWRSALRELPWKHHAIILRAIFALFFVAAGAVLLSILRNSNQSPWYAILLAWNPLATLEVAGMGHLDAAGIFFILLSLRSLQRHSPLQAAIWLALACGIKPIAALIFPWLFFPALRRAEMRIAAFTISVFIGVAFLTYLPITLQSGSSRWLHTMSNFSEHWEANGSFYELIRSIGVAAGGDGYRLWIAKLTARRLAPLILLIVAIRLLIRRAPIERAGYGLFLTLLLTSPVAYPWYLLWLLCFVPLLQGRLGYAALTWSATASIAHLLWRHLDPGGLWRLSGVETAIQYLPVYLALIVELRALRREVSDDATLALIDS